MTVKYRPIRNTVDAFYYKGPGIHAGFPWWLKESGQIFLWGPEDFSTRIIFVDPGGKPRFLPAEIWLVYGGHGKPITSFSVVDFIARYERVEDDDEQ